MRIRHLLLLASVVGVTLDYAAESPEALVEAGHFKRAKPLVEALYKANPNDAKTVRMMAQVRSAFGDADGALPLAEKAVQLDPKNPEYRLGLADVLGQLAQKGSMFSKLGMAKRAKKELETAVELKPDYPLALGALSQYYRLVPGIAGGDRAKSQQLAQQVTKLDPGRGYLLQAQTYDWAKEPAAAEALLKKGVEAAPAFYQGRTALGNFYLNQKKFDLAEQQGREAIRIDANRVSGYGLLAAAFAGQKKYSEMDVVLSEAEKRSGDNLSPYFVAARALLAFQGDGVKAESYLRKYLSVPAEGSAPTHAVAHWQLGLALEKQGKKSDAVKELELAVAAQPELESAKKDLKRVKG